MSTKAGHPFHMVAPSPWPAAGALSAFIMVIGLVNYMHGGTAFGLIPGIACVLGTMYGWWRDVIHESEKERAHTKPVVFGLKMGMALFITSEVMFFSGFFWAYLHNALLSSPVLGGQWPPAGIEPLEAFKLPLINTIILVTSGFVLMWGRQGLMMGDRKRLITGLLIAPLMGFLFVGLQGYEYGHAAFAFKSGIYASAFYMATGFHGFHVLVGATMLMVMFFRARGGAFTAEKHIGLEAAEWYWHFVDVVWLGLYSVFYVWVGLSS